MVIVWGARLRVYDICREIRLKLIGIKAEIADIIRGGGEELAGDRHALSIELLVSGRVDNKT